MFQRLDKLFSPQVEIGNHSSLGGFTVIKSLLTSNGVERFTAELQHMLMQAGRKWIEENSAATANGQLVVVHSIDTPSDFFFEAARNQRLFTLASQFAGMAVTPLYVEYFDKPPRSNSWTPPHQDHAFYNAHFPDELGITFWVALDACNQESGAICILPTNEKKLLSHVKSSHVGFHYELENYDLEKYKPLKLTPGDAVLFGSYTPHYCPINNTSKSRRAIAISFRTSQYREMNN